MRHAIATIPVTGQNLVEIRDLCRAVGTLFGLDKMDGTRFITAVSEIARNVVQHARDGTVTFLLDEDAAHGAPQSVVAEIADAGPGIADLQGALAG